MSRKIAISFDDGRCDQLQTGIAILKKYGLCGTLYVTTSYVDRTMSDSLKEKFGTDAITIKEIIDAYHDGIEIGSHSDKHTNTPEDIAASIQKLDVWLGYKAQWGFASPGSVIYKRNVHEIADIQPRISYVRTSGRLRNHNLFYIGLFLLNRYLYSKTLFIALNKENILLPGKCSGVLNSVAVRNETPVNHLIALCESLGEDEGLVFCFHSIRNETKEDMWSYRVDDFERFCCYISENPEYESLTVSSLVTCLGGIA